MGWTGGAGYYSPTQRIEEIPDHSGPQGLAKGMPGLEVDDGEASLSCGRVRGASAPFIGRGWGAGRESRTKTGRDYEAAGSGRGHAQQTEGDGAASVVLFVGTLRGGRDEHY